MRSSLRDAPSDAAPHRKRRKTNHCTGSIHQGWRSSRPSGRRCKWLLAVAGVAGVGLQGAWAASTSAVPRWGQSSCLVSSLFLVYGGKTQGTTGGGYTYTSGPSTADLLALDLSESFATGVGSDAPWQSIPADTTLNVSTSDGTRASPPVVAWGTTSPLTHEQVLLFGGDGSPDVPVQTGNDSVYTFQIANDTTSLAAVWTKVPDSWSQPMRSIYHSAESDGKGGVWLVGGKKADGSGLDLDQMWLFNHSSADPRFTAGLAPPGSIVGGTATLLADGTLLLLGGEDASGQLQSFDNVVTYDTTKATWSSVKTRGVNGSSAAVPTPRRGHVAVSLPDQRLFLHGGSPTTDMSTALGDAWILDWSVDPPRWSQLDTGSGAPSARFGHSAVGYGRKVVITLGWTGSTAADTAVYVFDGTSLSSSAGDDGAWSGGSWATSYSPDPEATTSALPSGGSSTSSGTSGSDGSSNGVSSGNTGSSTGGTSSSGSDGSSSGGSGSSGSSGSDGSDGSTDGSISSTNNPGGNGSSTSSGGDGGSSSTDSGSFGSPATTATTSGDKDGDNSGSGGTSSAAKAGAIIGAFVGVGLAVAAGYAIYHRRSEGKRLNDWRSGEGGGALLGAAGAMGGREEDEHYFGGAYAEKGPMYTNYAAGNKRPAGPRNFTPSGAAIAAGAAGLLSAAGAGLAGKRKRDEEQAPMHTQANVGRDGGMLFSPGSYAGHAIEGSGPGMRERLAMITGLASWVPQGNQPRFDMLADEDDDERRGAYAMGGLSGAAAGLAASNSRRRVDDFGDEDDEGHDEEAGIGRHIREQSYGRLGQAEPGDHDRSFEYRNVAEQDEQGSERVSHDDDPYTTSPFEDPSPRRPSQPGGPRSYGAAAGVAIMAAAGAAGAALRTASMSYAGNHRRLASDDGHSVAPSRVSHDFGSAAVHSDVSHASTRTSATQSGQSRSSAEASFPSTGSSSRATSGATSGMAYAFSDAPHGSRGNTLHQRSYTGMPMGPRISDATGSMGSMRRSPTWWARLMEKTSLDRTASGRLLPSPGAHEPIRDPAPPPALALSIIKESPRSANPSEDVGVFVQSPGAYGSANSRRDSVGGAIENMIDELGRRTVVAGQSTTADGQVMLEGEHGRSLSSLQSARTGASSHLEARLRGMDVIQRTRTGSSRHTASTRRTGTIGSGSYTYSRGPSEAGSLGAQSRMGSLSEVALPERGDDVDASVFSQTPNQSDLDGTPGQMVWGPGDWNFGVTSPATVPEETESWMEEYDGDGPRMVRDEEGSMTIIARGDSEEPDDSMDIAAAQDEDVTATSGATLAMAKSPFGDEYQESRYEEGLSFGRGDYNHLQRNVSEVPSLTPSTTKRARRNPALTSPLTPQPRSPPPPPRMGGTVKERIHAIEERRRRTLEIRRMEAARGAEDTDGPLLPRSPGAGVRPGGPMEAVPLSPRKATTLPVASDKLSPTKSTSTGGSASAGQTASSAGAKKKADVSHGLVPKAQIVIANPDKGSSG